MLARAVSVGRTRYRGEVFGHMTADGDHAARHRHCRSDWLSVGGGMLTGEMSRHTTFRFCLDPTVGQLAVLARHAGAARFAFNQCLGMVKTALAKRKADPAIDVPWTGFDLINTFNGWKKNPGRRPGLHRRHHR